MKKIKFIKYLSFYFLLVILCVPVFAGSRGGSVTRFRRNSDRNSVVVEKRNRDHHSKPTARTKRKPATARKKKY